MTPTLSGVPTPWGPRRGFPYTASPFVRGVDLGQPVRVASRARAKSCLANSTANRGLCRRYRPQSRRGSVARRNNHSRPADARAGSLRLDAGEEVEGGAHAEHHVPGRSLVAEPSIALAWGIPARRTGSCSRRSRMALTISVVLGGVPSSERLDRWTTRRPGQSLRHVASSIDRPSGLPRRTRRARRRAAPDRIPGVSSGPYTRWPRRRRTTASPRRVASRRASRGPRVDRRRGILDRRERPSRCSPWRRRRSVIRRPSPR